MSEKTAYRCSIRDKNGVSVIKFIKKHQTPWECTKMTKGKETINFELF